MFSTVLAAFLAATISATLLSSPPQTENPQSLPPGTLLPKVVTLKNAQQSYALYLPLRYSPAQRWPMVYVFDPLARGELALRQFQHAAELHGFIVAASNNSRNGPWAPQFEAAQAMVSDTQQRFSIDTKRIYFAGFSGGARVSSQLALLCKCAAGVLLSGAGFPHNSPPSPDANFAVFSAVGNADFNYREIIPLQDQLEKAASPRWLRVVDGPHEWAPPAVLDEALAWFRLQAMKSNLEPRDDNSVAAQFAATKQRAATFEKSADLLSAWREYRQAAASFDSLTDASALRSRAAALERNQEVRDSLKRERSAFEEQDRLSDDVLSAISASPASSPNSAERYSMQSAQQLARDLHQRSVKEKRADRALILKRALGGVFIGSIESGNAALENQNYALAAQYFGCAAEANPESEGALRQLAVARALAGDQKGATEALRAARKITKDVVSFSGWLNQEHAFDHLRPAVDFQSLKDNP
jgi:predicted esterase